jgi:hypothetical protein
LKKILDHDFEGWVSEQTLKQESSTLKKHQTSSGQRILDGEFFFTAHKSRYIRKEDGALEGLDGGISETWRGGVELELSLKSPERYRKQFRNLENTLLGASTGTQKIQLLLFLCGSNIIFDRLYGYMTEKEYRYGNCLFLFGHTEDFFQKLGKSKLIKALGKNRTEILAENLNKVKVVVQK